MGIIVGILGILLLVGDNFVMKAMGVLFLITGIMNVLVAIVFNLTMGSCIIKIPRMENIIIIVMK